MNTTDAVLFKNFTMDNLTHKDDISTSLTDVTTTSFAASTTSQLITTVEETYVPKPLTIDDILGVYWEYNTARELGLHGYPVIIALGTMGNILTLLVMLRKKMRQRTTCFYMAIIAMFDTLVLYFACLRQWLALLHGNDALSLSSSACKIFNFLTYTFFDISVWLLVIMTVERFLVVRFPLHAPKISSIPRARIAVITLVIIMALVNLHFFWTVHLDERGRCIYVEEFEHFHDNIWPWIDATVYSFLPFLFLLIFNLLIIIIHRRSVILRRTTLNISKSRTRDRRSNQGTQLRLSAMLLLVTFTFLLLSAPNVLLICLRHKYFDFSVQVDDFRDIAIYRLVSMITMFCLYLNHAVNFFLYCITGQMFRRELLKIVTCQCDAARARSSMFSDFTTRTARLSESSMPSSPDLVRRQTDYI
ncbi:probable G-protein coupled receptor 139 [Ruditapes philippinarum]|uniref:probable G-protein coupled receptor 139 n=1 Tax=Ruditapes philippinarum TaxID=129788 RepID=UPI00295A9315|nr:probable G-protein coupled receptor 139 [Ruditapes philippinarum]